MGKAPRPVISVQLWELIPLAVNVSAKLNPFLIENIATLQSPGLCNIAKLLEYHWV